MRIFRIRSRIFAFFILFSTDLFGIQKEFDEPFFQVKNTLGSVSKPNRAILSSVVGAGFVCPKTQSKLFSGEQPRPYELNDSIIHVLTQPRVKACSLTRNETPQKSSLNLKKRCL